MRRQRFDLSADQSRVVAERAVAAVQREASFELACGDGDGAERRAELVRGAGGERRERSQPLAPRDAFAREGELALAFGELVRHASQEVDDERRGDAERDPHAAKVPVEAARGVVHAHSRHVVVMRVPGTGERDVVHEECRPSMRAKARRASSRAEAGA